MSAIITVQQHEIEELRSVKAAAIDALCDAAQFIDAVKQEAMRDGWWSEWDGQMREKITTALRLAHGQSEDGKQ